MVNARREFAQKYPGATKKALRAILKAADICAQDPGDTFRFHALRLHEVGMITTNPNQLIAQGSNWRFLNELKKELKA